MSERAARHFREALERDEISPEELKDRAEELRNSIDMSVEEVEELLGIDIEREE